MKRILIINAKTSADIAYAANLVRHYEVDHVKYEKRPGRYNLIFYTAYGVPDAAVWHTKNQITVRYADDD